MSSTDQIENKMLKSAFVLTTTIFVFIWIVTNVSLAASSSSTCQELVKYGARVSKGLPTKIDKYTTLIKFTVNCETKVVKYIKQLAVTKSDLAKGFKVRKQRQHTNLHCSKKGLASAFGWTAAETIYDQNTNLLASFVTTPAMCRGRGQK